MPKIKSKNKNNNNFGKAVDALTTNLSRINSQHIAMEPLVEQMQTLQQQIAAIKEQVSALDKTPKIEEYKEITVDVKDVKDISLGMFKTLPEFNRERSKYSAWRNLAMNVMKILKEHTATPKYFEALNIVRSKIVGPTSEVMTNYNTVFNFDAIISRLDFTYSDKRPIYIIEQSKIFMMK